MTAKRLIEEFEAQDVGAWLTVFRDGNHTRVAKWVEGNQVWEVLPEGRALLASTEPALAEEEAPPVVVPKIGKRKSAVILDEDPEAA
jgi:hypothetical protein